MRLVVAVGILAIFEMTPSYAMAHEAATSSCAEKLHPSGALGEAVARLSSYVEARLLTEKELGAIVDSTTPLNPIANDQNPRSMKLARSLTEVINRLTHQEWLALKDTVVVLLKNLNQTAERKHVSKVETQGLFKVFASDMIPVNTTKLKNVTIHAINAKYFVFADHYIDPNGSSKGVQIYFYNPETKTKRLLVAPMIVEKNGDVEPTSVKIAVFQNAEGKDVVEYEYLNENHLIQINEEGVEPTASLPLVEPFVPRIQKVLVEKQVLKHDTGEDYVLAFGNAGYPLETWLPPPRPGHSARVQRAFMEVQEAKRLTINGRDCLVVVGIEPNAGGGSSDFFAVIYDLVAHQALYFEYFPLPRISKLSGSPLAQWYSKPSGFQIIQSKTGAVFWMNPANDESYFIYQIYGPVPESKGAP